MVVDPVSPGADDSCIPSEEESEGYFSKAYDDFRFDQFYSFYQPDGAAEASFLNGGRPVSMGPAFDDICHIDMISCNSHGKEGFIEELARGTYEGCAVVIFDASRSFPDDHHGRIGRSRGKDRPQASLFAKGTLRAAPDGIFYFFMIFEMGFFFLRSHHFPMPPFGVFFGIFVSK